MWSEIAEKDPSLARNQDLDTLVTNSDTVTAVVKFIHHTRLLGQFRQIIDTQAPIPHPEEDKSKR